jgi:guanine nucleotide-binding protein subunit alpha
LYALDSFFKNLDRLFASGYVPNDQDILHCHAKTTGVAETRLNVGTLIYRIFDVCGQHLERKKWIHCFEDVTVILFVAAISDYDWKLIKDRETVSYCAHIHVLSERLSHRQLIITTHALEPNA